MTTTYYIPSGTHMYRTQWGAGPTDPTDGRWMPFVSTKAVCYTNADRAFEQEAPGFFVFRLPRLRVVSYLFICVSSNRVEIQHGELDTDDYGE